MGHQVAFVSIYRLTFHPLARYPGPLLGRLSGWAIVIQAASGNRHLESWKEHETYGKSFDSLIAVVSNVKENQVPSSASAQTPYPSIPSQPYEKSTAPANPTLKKLSGTVPPTPLPGPSAPTARLIATNMRSAAVFSIMRSLTVPSDLPRSLS